MTTEIYKYAFNSDVPHEGIEASLVLAILAAGSLHGDAEVRLEVAHFFDRNRRACVIDAGTAVGRDFNRVFVGFVTREFGADAFRVTRVATYPRDRLELHDLPPVIHVRCKNRRIPARSRTRSRGTPNPRSRLRLLPQRCQPTTVRHLGSGRHDRAPPAVSA